MNVYDWDKTIYHGDCTVDFYFWNLRRNPSLIRYMPLQAIGFIGYFLKIHDKTRMKKYFYSYLRGVEDIDRKLEEFWDGHIGNVHQWYLDNQKEDDVVISASAAFMVAGGCRRLGIKNLIASEVDRFTGEPLSPNCNGAQKPVRFLEAGYTLPIEEFYSDSYGDDPMAKLAKKSYLVKGETLIPWEK